MNVMTQPFLIPHDYYAFQVEINNGHILVCLCNNLCLNGLNTKWILKQKNKRTRRPFVKMN